MTSQYNALLSKSNHYARAIAACPLTRTGACNTYFTVYLPAITYSLKASSLKVEELERIQSKAMQSFLNKMGCHQITHASYMDQITLAGTAFVT